MNLNRGLHRVFAIASGIWFFYCLVIFPINSVEAEQKSAIATHSLDIASCSSVKVGREECLEKASSDFKHRLETIGFVNFYTNVIKEDSILFVVAIVVGVPILIYALARIFFTTIRWAIAGFKE